MNKSVSPAQIEADKASGGDWSYGTRVEQSAEGPPVGGDAGRPAPGEGAGAGAAAQKSERAPADEPAIPPPHGKSEPERSGDRKPDVGVKPEDREAEDAPPRAPRKMVFVVALLVLAGALAWGAYGHWRQTSASETTRQATIDLVPEVRTTEAKTQDQPVALTLPGQTEAFATANIYPRATGYIGVRNVDIGSRVKKGDLLVHIVAPDLDQQLAQAQAQVGQVKAAEEQAAAQVNQAEANLALAKVTLARTSSLTQQGYETLQNRDNQTANQQSQQAAVDTAKAGVKVAVANTKAQIATVDRLGALAGFENVLAPFDGVVTTRNVDLGDLVNADSTTSSPMFTLARDDIIRVIVQVPQNEAIGVRDGLAAKVLVAQMPGQKFSGTVTRSSVALLSSARTLTTEVDIANPDGRLRAGLFVDVTMSIPREHPGVVIPAETLIFNQHGLQVAVVEGDHVKLHDVKISKDFGTTVELSEGLNGGEQVVLSPPAILRDDAKVDAKTAEDQRPEGSDQPDQTKKADPEAKASN